LESVSKSGRDVSAATILSVIGGALMIAGGLGGLYMYSAWNQFGMPGWGSMMGGWGMPAGAFLGVMAGTSIISLAAGGVVVAGSYFIHTKPESSREWGVGILVASIAGLFGMGGFLIGPILGIIGGILALTKK